MKRIIVKAPVGISLTALATDQQAAIRAAFVQFALPMPATRPSAGYFLIDALVADSFEVAAISRLGLPFDIVGLWQWDGRGQVVVLQVLDPDFIDYLPGTVDYGGQSHAPVLHEPHRWAGWPEAF